MNRRSILTVSAVTALGLAVPSGYALGQTAKDLVGTWTWTSVDLIRADGTKTQPFGANPKGYVIFDSNGRFAYLLTRPDRAKFAANNREQGTPEENKASVLGVLAYSGRYSISDGGKTLIFHIEASSYPNAEGVDQKRSITLTEDELKWINPAPTVAGGGTAHTALRRVK
jgi:Lipocalin-like domain